MGKTVLLRLITIFFTFCVHEGCIACSNGYNEVEEVILGANVSLSCISSRSCDEIKWDKRISGIVVPHSGKRRQVNNYRSYLDIPGISFHDNGRYTCFCYRSLVPQEVCFVTLNAICQATVLLNGKTTLYNSSLTSTHFVNVNAGERIKIGCPEYATPGTNCTNIQLKGLRTFAYNFKVLWEHHSCHIVCQSNSACSVNFTLHVTVLETSTNHSNTFTRVSTVSSQPSVKDNALTVTSTGNIPPAPATVVTVSAQPSVKQSTSSIIPNDRSISVTAHTTMQVVQQTEKDNAVPDKSGSFPVMVLTGISIVVFVGILSIICFFIYFSRSKPTSRQKKIQNQGNESPDTNIPIGPTYATVNKSLTVGSKYDEDSDRGILCTDDAYAEVNSAVKEEHVNAVKEETSITKDYYSVVNTSNTKLESTNSGNKSDSALYTEVNKGVKQAGKKLGTSSPESSDCSPIVSEVQPYDVLEQHDISEYDAVGVASTSSALYAVVDKDRKKE